MSRGPTLTMTGMRTGEARVNAGITSSSGPKAQAGSRSPTRDTSTSGSRFTSVRSVRSVRADGDTKTERSRRTLEVPEEAALALKALHKQRAAQRLKAGERWQDTSLVFSTRNGGRQRPQDVPRQHPQGRCRVRLDAPPDPPHVRLHPERQRRAHRAHRRPRRPSGHVRHRARLPKIDKLGRDGLRAEQPVCARRQYEKTSQEGTHIGGSGADEIHSSVTFRDQVGRLRAVPDVVRAENPVRGPEQHVCSSGHPP
jgi:hypothetical protein